MVNSAGRKERKKIGTQIIVNLILFALVTLCVMVDGIHASAHPDHVSLFTRPSTCTPQGYIGHASVIGVTLSFVSS